MRTRSGRLLVPLFVIVSLSLANAQNTTTYLSGTVKDASGVPVANANVSLKNVSTGQTSEVQADAQGKYQFSGLAAGQYEISATAEGFSAKTITVSVSGRVQSADLALERSTGPSLSDLGFSTAQTQSNLAEQARLDRRTHMLKIHQKMGLITTAPMAATIISGLFAGGKRTSSSSRDLHVGLGSATAGLYFTTAYFAIFAPRIQGTETRGPIRLHKALAWIHGPGMILTPILGAMAFQQKSRGQHVHGLASLHGPVAVITGAAYGAALLSVSIKF
ncbi:MAG TPA: carboxypeptidase-like regulatory domain-containing protein [Terriglobales bacterium]